MPKIVVELSEPVHESLSQRADREGRDIAVLVGSFATTLANSEMAANQKGRSLAERQEALVRLKNYVQSLPSLRTVGIVDDSREAIYEGCGE